MSFLVFGLGRLKTLFASYFTGLITHAKHFITPLVTLLVGVPLLIIFVDAAVIPQIRTLDPLILRFFKTITHLGLSSWILLPTALFILYTLFFSDKMPLRSFYIFATIALSGLIIQPFKWSIGRARPPLFEKEGVLSFYHFNKSAMFYSFPSGHATTAAALTTCLCLLFPRYRLLIIPIGFLAIISRTIIGSHYPSDIFAGTLIGFSFAYVGYLWLKSVEKPNS